MAEKTTYRTIQVIKFGEPLAVKELPIPTPGKNQLLVKIAYAPINPSDISATKGFYDTGKQPPFTPGFEGSGVIVEVGPELLVQHKVGDRVSVIGVGTWGEYVLIDSYSAFPISQENSLEEAASHWVNPATATLMIEEEVVKGNHKAVIHTAGASALGRMLIRYLKEIGVKSINIVRKDEYIKELQELGADYVLNSTAPDFEVTLKKIANEESATLCFEAVGGALFGKVVSAMPPKSHVLSYGALESGSISGVAVPDLLFNQKVLRGFWLTALAKSYNLKQLQELGAKCQLKLKTTLKSEINKIFKYEEVNEALEYYKKFASKGKILFHP